MRGSACLLSVVTKATLIVIAGCFALALAASAVPGSEPRPSILGIVVVLFLPVAIATWRMFQRLQTHYTGREARAVAITFTVLAPVSLGTAMVFAQFAGGYSELVFGGRFVLVGVFLGAFITMMFLSFAACAFALSITRRQMEYEDLAAAEN
jgi:hypothetical protein